MVKFPLKCDMSQYSPPAPVPPMNSLDGDFIDGAVSIARLLALYGAEHVEVIDALWSAEDTEFIVLFANDEETQYALLPVGPAHRYKSLASAMSREIDGLHAVCHAATKVSSKPAALALPEAGWNKIKREFPAEAEELEDIIGESPDSDTALLNILRHVVGAKQQLNYARVKLGKQETMLMKREEHVMSSAQRIEELMAKYGAWETLREQMELLESREKFVHDAETRLLNRAHELDTYAQELDSREATLPPAPTR